MKSNIKNSQGIRAIVSLVVLVLIVGLSIIPKTNADDSKKADSLYIGDQTDPDASDNTVKRFNATTGEFQGAFVTSNSGGLHGPRGLIFDHPGARLLVVNQNQDLEPLSGEILRYNGKTGAFLKAIVPATRDADTNAPGVPRGMVLWDQKIVFVADLSASTFCSPPGPCPSGRLLAFTKNGKFLANLNPIGLSTEFHPRGVVVGPDGLLYVSNFPDLATGLGGQVLRFDPETGNFTDVFITSAGGVGELNRPEGLVYGPDGNLYITSFRDNFNVGIEGNTDMIRIYNGTTGSFIDKIDLDVVGQARAFAQALLFGPGGFLFVPITGNGPDTGAVRRYNVAAKTFDNFVSPSAQGGPLGTPEFLTFGDTDPGTLAYTRRKRR